MVEALFAILPVSLTSGINLYLTVLGLGIAGRANWLELPMGLSALENPIVLVVAGVLFIVEFFADKIPYVDSIWDFLHTVVRPAGALLLALGIAPSEPPEAAFALALLAGTTALTAHSTKASFRALVNTSPEPVSNSAVSVAEDAVVVGLLALAIRFPITTAVLSAILAMLMLVATVLIFRWARRTFGSVMAFLRRGRQEVVVAG